MAEELENPIERRSSVRMNFEFNIKLKRMTREQYDAMLQSEQENFTPWSFMHDSQSTDMQQEADLNVNTALMGYLLKLEDKLDEVLYLLKGDKTSKYIEMRGVGTALSGTGMQIGIEKEIDVGNVLRMKFFISKSPLLFLDVFGEVRWVRRDESASLPCQAGVEFMNMRQHDQEQIVQLVFKKQREMIRKMKNEDETAAH